MAPIRTTPSTRTLRTSDSILPRNTHAQPPTGYNNKTVQPGIRLGARFKSNYKGIYEGPGPYHIPLSLPVPDGLRPAGPRGPSLNLNDLECVKPLGQGGNGQVLLVRTRGVAAASTGSSLFALKSLRKKQLRSMDVGDCSLRSSERAVLADMPWNPFVVGTVEGFHDDRNVYLMLEYTPCGTLHKLMGAPLPAAHILFYFANIVCALEHLEKVGVVHRDIKPGNILVGADGYLQLCDFGTARIVPAPGEAVKNSDWMGDGTAPYQCPEGISLKGQPANMRFGTAEDWWSVGITLYEMTTGSMPFNNPPNYKDGAAFDTAGMQFIWERIMAGPPRWPRHMRIGRNLKALIRGLLTVDANARLGAGGVAEVMQHPWASTVDWTKMRRKRYVPPHVVTPSPDFLFSRDKLVPKHFPGLRMAA